MGDTVDLPDTVRARRSGCFTVDLDSDCVVRSGWTVCRSMEVDDALFDRDDADERLLTDRSSTIHEYHEPEQKGTFFRVPVPP